MAMVAIGGERNVACSMAPFLSPEWVEQFNAAVAGVDLGPGTDLSVAHVVGDGVRLVVRVSGGRARASLADGGATDVTLREDRATAAAIARGAMTVQQAAAAGRIKVTGDVALLVRRGPALAALSAATAGLRDATSYD
jgi:SCP-2 sterol transfer family